jgi:predicted glutamine amidotransferase
MCRLLGIVSSEPVEFKVMLKEAPKSLCFLSREHPHGWGIAVFGRESTAETPCHWQIEKAPECASDDKRFHEIAVQSRGVCLVAHVRQRTVGPLSHDNTHPFLKDGWVFCHNGTIKDVDFLKANTSEKRLSELSGQTDSELLLAYLLSAVDAAACIAVADSRFESALMQATRVITEREDFGSCNYLLGNGRTMFAHRFGRTLYMLERVSGDPVIQTRVSQETGAVIETPWSDSRQAILVASEAMTDEPWQALEERTLLRFDRDPMPRCKVLFAPSTRYAA